MNLKSDKLDRSNKQKAKYQKLAEKETLNEALFLVTDKLEEKINELNMKIVDLAVPFAPHTTKLIELINKRNILQDTHDNLYSLIEQPELVMAANDEFTLIFDSIRDNVKE